MTKILYIPEGRYLTFALPAEFPVSEHTGVSGERSTEFEASFIYLRYYDLHIFSVEYADMFRNVLNKTKSPIEDFIDKFDANENLYTVASELYRESSAILRNYCLAPLDFNGNSKLTHLAEFCSLGLYAPKLEPEDFV